MTIDPVAKRNFFLMLSVMGGQKIAADAGFSLPSEDVQKIELLDVFKKWMILSGAGVTDIIHECARWSLELNGVIEEMPEDQIDDTLEVLVSFSVALISLFLDAGTLKINESVEFSEDKSEKFIRSIFKSIIEDLDE